MTDFATIAVFAYRRPEHLARCLESLAANRLAAQSDLFIFCDGPKSDADREAVAAVRERARSKQWCGSVRIEESPVNRGLATSISAGVTKLCAEFARVIVIE